MTGDRDEDNRQSNPYASFETGRDELASAAITRRRSVARRLWGSVAWGIASFAAMYLLYAGVYVALGAPWTKETPWMAGVAASAVGIATGQAGVLHAIANGVVRRARCWIVSGASVPVAAIAGVFFANALVPPRGGYEPSDPTAWNVFVCGTLAIQLLLGAALAAVFWQYARLRMPPEPESPVKQ